MKRKLSLSFLVLTASLLFVLSVPVLPHSHSAAAQSANSGSQQRQPGGSELGHQGTARRSAGDRRSVLTENY